MFINPILLNTILSSFFSIKFSLICFASIQKDCKALKIEIVKLLRNPSQFHKPFKSTTTKNPILEREREREKVLERSLVNGGGGGGRRSRIDWRHLEHSAIIGNDRSVLASANTAREFFLRTLYIAIVHFLRI